MVRISSHRPILGIKVIISVIVALINFFIFMPQAPHKAGPRRMFYRLVSTGIMALMASVAHMTGVTTMAIVRSN